jgi:DNA polymerase-3 subunit epsilon
MTFACIDFETTNSKRTSACQLGVALVAEGTVTQTRSWLVRPEPFEFQKIVCSKHGLTEDDLRDCPRFCDIWPEVSEFIGSAPLVAHNAGFDMSVMRHTLEFYDFDVPRVNYLCTVQIARTLWSYPCNSLPFLAAVFDIPLEHHDAKSDANACAEILLRAMDELGTFDTAEFLSLLPVDPGILVTPWGHERPQSTVRRHTPTSIIEYFDGQLADLNGLTVSASGTLGRGITRDHLELLVEAAGGVFHARPKKGTEMFVVGPVDAGRLAAGEEITRKHSHALKLFRKGSGICIVTADDFLQILLLDETEQSITSPQEG